MTFSELRKQSAVAPYGPAYEISLRGPVLCYSEANMAGWNGSEEESEGQLARLIKFILPCNASKEGGRQPVLGALIGQGARQG